MRIILLLFTSISILFSSCQKDQAAQAIHFYHWKTKLNLNQHQINALDSLAVQKLYLRFFDVTYSVKGPKPIAVLNWKEFDLGRKIEIIPTVFVTNSTLKSIGSPQGVDSLAMNMSQKLSQMINKIDTTAFSINEIQIDCDWSLETQAKYFRLLELLKQGENPWAKISATIRLHQVKYFTKTGVPPVDKGVLMFYNMGKVTDWKEDNSILNLETAKKYLYNFEDYPLALDVALPIFAWGVQFRNERLVQLINDVSEKELDQHPDFEKLANQRYRVKKSTYLKGHYIYQDDEIRLERVRLEDLKEAKDLLSKRMRSTEFDLIFYHLDNSCLKDFSVSDLKSI